MYPFTDSRKITLVILGSSYHTPLRRRDGSVRPNLEKEVATVPVVIRKIRHKTRENINNKKLREI